MHVHFATAHIVGIQHLKTGMVQRLDGVDIALIANNFPVIEGKEVGAAMPLFTVLIPVLIATTENGLHLHAASFQAFQHVGVLLGAGLAMVTRDEGGGLSCKYAGLFNHGLVHHHLVGTQEGMHHVQMDERIGVMWQFLSQDAEIVTLSGKFLSQVDDTFGIGADALTDAKQVGSGHLHITALCTGTTQLLLGADGVGMEYLIEDGSENQRLSLANRKGHRVDKHLVVERRGGITREEEVVERL